MPRQRLCGYGSAYNCYFCLRKFRQLDQQNQHLRSGIHLTEEFRCIECRCTAICKKMLTEPLVCEILLNMEFCRRCFIQTVIALREAARLSNEIPSLVKLESIPFMIPCFTSSASDADSKSTGVRFIAATLKRGHLISGLTFTRIFK